jgi:hypothetical protein
VSWFLPQDLRGYQGAVWNSFTDVMAIYRHKKDSVRARSSGKQLSAHQTCQKRLLSECITHAHALINYEADHGQVFWCVAA